MARSTAVPASLPVSQPSVATPWLYRTLHAPVRSALARFFDLSVEGVEHLPACGPYIVAANHHNYLDGVVLAAVSPVPIAFIVMPRVYRATPLHPFFHRHIRSIPITLERPDVGALRRALAALDEGRVVGIFPEGPFSVRGQLEAGLPGVGLLALRSGAAVLPAAIRGTYEALRGRRFYIPRRARLAVRFGPPRHFAGEDEKGGRAARARVTERIMDDIAALLC
jgi:1-acyl-sn-glycerol-3-phosphate acyltransferase